MNHANSSNSDPAQPRVRCFDCLHLVEWPYCLAFLSGTGIPEDIRLGMIEHTDPYPGDHGIRFLPSDSLYALSEEAVKELLRSYRGETILPPVAQPVHPVPTEIIAETQPEAEILPGVGDQLDSEFQAELASRLAAELDAIMDDRDLQRAARLFEACRRGDLEGVRGLLDQGLDANIQDGDGNTPLMAACRHCHLDIVRLLLIKGSDVDMRNSYSKSALDIATDWGYPTIVQLLKAYGAQESDPSLF